MKFVKAGRGEGFLFSQSLLKPYCNIKTFLLHHIISSGEISGKPQVHNLYFNDSI